MTNVAKVKEIFSKLEKIKNYAEIDLRKSPSQLHKVVENVKEEVQHLHEQKDDDIQNFHDALNSLSNSDTLKLLLSDKVDDERTPADTAVAVLGVISKLSCYAGPIGQSVSSLAALVSLLIGGRTGGKAGDMAERTVKKALRDHSQEELMVELSGLARLYREAQTYMNTLGTGKDLTASEVTHILSMYSLTREPIRLLEKLRRHIERNLKQRTVEGARQVLKLTRMYCQMSTTRWLLLYQMCHLASQCKETNDTARGMKAVLGLRVRHPELKWLLQPATPAEALPSALYLPSVYPDIHRYIHFTCMSEELQEESIPGVLRDLPQPPTTPVLMAVEKWSSSYLHVDRTPRRSLRYAPKGDGFTFEFQPANGSSVTKETSTEANEVALATGVSGATGAKETGVSGATTDLESIETRGDTCVSGKPSDELWRLHSSVGNVIRNKRNMYGSYEDDVVAEGEVVDVLVRYVTTRDGKTMLLRWREERPAWLYVHSTILSRRFLKEGGTQDPGVQGYWNLNN